MKSVTNRYALSLYSRARETTKRTNVRVQLQRLKIRVLALIGVLPILAGREGRGRHDLYCDGSLKGCTVLAALNETIPAAAILHLDTNNSHH